MPLVSNPQKGDLVWIPDIDQAFLPATVLSVQGATVTVECTSKVCLDTLRLQTVSIPVINILPGFPADQLDQTDLIQLPELHEAAVLESLKLRYSGNKIYTYSGQVLVALNPYAAVENLYGPEVMASYSEVGLPHPVPHIYALGEQAFRRMLQTNQPQSILVRSSSSLMNSGESGAGKTESTSHLLQYFAAAHQLAAPSTATALIRQQVLESTPILEAFGNARTLRNDNSSRFGKYIELAFMPGIGTTLGASIQVFLLEKSRVVLQSQVPCSLTWLTCRASETTTSSTS